MIRISKQTASEGNFSIGGQSSRPPSDTSPHPRGSEPCIRALANEVTLKLGQRSHQMKDKLAAWRCCIDLLR